MELYLDNVGKIKDSTIKINGLTVITGPNDSGKTTVGKTLYALASAVENLDGWFHTDEIIFVWHEVRQILTKIDNHRVTGAFFNGTLSHNIFWNNWEFVNEPFKFMGLNQGIRQTDEILLDLLASLKTALRDGQTTAAFDRNININIFPRIADKDAKPERIQSKHEIIADIIDSAIFQLNETERKLRENSDKTRFFNSKIQKVLEKEFNLQIYGIKSESVRSVISLDVDDDLPYSITLDNNILSDSKLPFHKGLGNCILIDDGNVIDRLGNDGRLIRDLPDDAYPVFGKTPKNTNETKFTQFIAAIDHETALMTALKSSNNNTIIEENINADKAKVVLEKLSSAVSGKMELVDGDYFINRLNVRNLASGSKMFLIIKMLIEKGFCKENTLLVLDEPETHLHPEWQAVFAEAIVLLRKELETTVVLTTHSPDFLLALEVFSKKHGINDVTHFYKSVKIDDYQVKIESYDGKVNEIHAELATPFLKLTAQRGSLVVQNSADMED